MSPDLMGSDADARYSALPTQTTRLLGCCGGGGVATTMSEEESGCWPMGMKTISVEPCCNPWSETLTLLASFLKLPEGLPRMSPVITETLHAGTPEIVSSLSAMASIVSDGSTFMVNSGLI